MTEKWPSRPEEPSKGPEETAFEKRVLEEMNSLREKRERPQESPSGKVNIPPPTEEGLRKMAEINVRLIMESEKRKGELEKEKKHIVMEGLTEKELEEIAKKRIKKG